MLRVSRHTLQCGLTSLHCLLAGAQQRHPGFCCLQVMVLGGPNKPQDMWNAVLRDSTCKCDSHCNDQLADGRQEQQGFHCLQVKVLGATHRPHNLHLAVLRDSSIHLVLVVLFASVSWLGGIWNSQACIVCRSWCSEPPTGLRTWMKLC